MDHAVDADVQTDEEAELGDVAHLPLDDRPHRVGIEKGLPGVGRALLETEADAPLDRVDVEHHDLDFLTGRDDLAWGHVLLGPAHLRDMHQPLDPGLELDEGAVVGDVGDPPLELVADQVFGLDAVPGIGLELLHAQRDALGLGVQADDLDLDGLIDVQHLGGMLDPAPRHVGDVEQAVDTAKVDEGAVIGDVLDHPVDDLALAQARDQLRTGLGAGFLEHGAARHHDVAAAPVHLENLKGLVGAQKGPDIAHRPHVDLASGQERHRAREVDREAALDAAKDDAGDPFVDGEGLFELCPGFLAARLVAADDRLAARVLHALEEDLDTVADHHLGSLSGD